jgi:hypothetical protein
LGDVAVPDTLTKFVVLSKEQVKSFKKFTSMKLVIAPLDTGVHTFPSLKLVPEEPYPAILATKPFTLVISESRAPQDTTLVDIAPTQKLKGELPYWAYYLIFGLLILAVLITAFIFLRKYFKKKAEEMVTPPTPVDNRPNWKRALDDLQNLKNEKLPETEQFIAFHYRLSEIMKLYLEAEYKFSANEMTTYEIRQYVKKQNFLSMKDQKEINDWLESCDRVKFAKQASTCEESYEKLEWFMYWLLQKGEKTSDVTTKAAGK